MFNEEKLGDFVITSDAAMSSSDSINARVVTPSTLRNFQQADECALGGRVGPAIQGDWQIARMLSENQG
jgi:hypothetical protein